jgi:hypothetical protein
MEGLTKAHGAAAALIVASVLAAPSAAFADVDASSVTSQAIIDTVVEDEGFREDRERIRRSGFTQFLHDVDARHRDSEAGRRGAAGAFQDTDILKGGGQLLGVDSAGSVDASFVDPEPIEGGGVLGLAGNELDLGFEVTGAPVKFALTGTIEASVSELGTTTESDAIVFAPGGGSSSVGIDAGSSGTASQTIDADGTLNPGTHTLRVELDTRAVRRRRQRPHLRARR